jgi:hypothetical protein
MAFVRVEQRSAHLASAVRLCSALGPDGQPVSKATLTAISKSRKGSVGKAGRERALVPGRGERLLSEPR